jgi:hypothetical protein
MISAEDIMKQAKTRGSESGTKAQVTAKPDIEGKSEPEVIEQIIEDLGQQDVLPTRSGEPIATETEPQVVGEDEINPGESWNSADAGKPHQAGRVALEDEVNPEELLVERGITEAVDELEELDETENPPDDNT